MVEKFKFVLLEYYCCGLAYPSYFYWGSLQGVFTLADILQYLFSQISDIPEKTTLPATMQSLLIDVHVFYHLLMLIHVSLITEMRNRF